MIFSSLHMPLPSLAADSLYSFSKILSDALKAGSSSSPFRKIFMVGASPFSASTGARPTIQFHQFLIAAYIGDGSPVDQYMWVDDLTIATGKP